MRLAGHRLFPCAIAALGAIAMVAAASRALAGEATCEAPPPSGKATPPRDYAPVFRQCVNEAGGKRLAIRRMTTDAGGLLLTVEPASLATSLEREACWICADTSDAAQADTRYLRAITQARASRFTPRGKPAEASARPDFLRNAGLVHGVGSGSFITGDLCPTRKPLDRDFMEGLERLGPGTPVALSISGLWLMDHAADFEWLRAKARAGALAITWVNHSFHHSWSPSRPLDHNFLLSPGTDARREILETERLLIAHGETPSVFFRFPGLVSDGALMDLARELHLVTLGADAWLAVAPSVPRPGAIVLVHPNGNEPEGLEVFARLANAGTLPRPFRPIAEAPGLAPEPAEGHETWLPPPPESPIPPPAWLTQATPPTLRKSPSANSPAR